MKLEIKTEKETITISNAVEVIMTPTQPYTILGKGGCIFIKDER